MTPLTPAAVTALAQQAAEPPYDPSCVECRRAAGKDLAGTTWQCVGHVYLERDRLRAALATAQAERSEALMECNCAVLERDAALQRAEQAEHAAAFDVMQAKNRHESDVATIQRVMRERDEARGTREQAEAALAQAQAERDEAKAESTRWQMEIVQRFRAESMPMDLTIYPTAPVAQPPALPPLPEGWVRESDECAENLGFVASWRGPLCHRVYLWPSGQTRIDANLPPDDLITVLRHAERAHQKLKEGNRG